MKQVIKYDINNAVRERITVHPQKDVEGLGMKITAFQGIPIGDCIMMEVDQTPDSLPRYITQLCYHSLFNTLF